MWGELLKLSLSDLLRLYIFLLDISLAESHVYNLPVTMYLAPSWSCCKTLEFVFKALKKVLVANHRLYFNNHYRLSTTTAVWSSRLVVVCMFSWSAPNNDPIVQTVTTSPALYIQPSRRGVLFKQQFGHFTSVLFCHLSGKRWPSCGLPVIIFARSGLWSVSWWIKFISLEWVMVKWDKIKNK